MFSIIVVRCPRVWQRAALMIFWLPAPLLHAQAVIPPVNPALCSQMLQNAEYPQAETCFRAALRSTPDSIEILNDLGISLARQNKETEAIDVYRHALTIKPGDPITVRNLAFAYFRSGRYAEALPALQAFADSTPGFQIDNITGLALFALDRYPEAAAYLERASRFEPKDLSTLDMLGKAYFKARNYDKVVDVFTRIMAIDPDSPAAHMMLGLTYDKLNREPEAEAEYLAAIRASPSYLGVHAALGQVYLREGKRDMAVAQFKQELATYPNDLVANSEMGALLRKQDRPSEAIPYLKKALATDPNYKDALFEYGKSEVMLGSPQAAIEPLERAVKLHPDFYQAHFVLGAALRKLGRTQQGNVEQAIAEKIQLANRKQNIRDVTGSEDR